MDAIEEEEIVCEVEEVDAVVVETETEFLLEVVSNDVNETSIMEIGEVGEIAEYSLQPHPDDISPQASISDAVSGMSVELPPELKAIMTRGFSDQDVEIFGDHVVTLYEHSKTIATVLIGWLFNTFGLLPNSEAGDRYIPAILQYLKSRRVNIGRSTLYEYINTYMSMQEMPKLLNSEQLIIYNDLNFTSKRFIARLRDPQHIRDIFEVLQLQSLTTRELLDLVDSKRGLKKQVKNIWSKKAMVELTEKDCCVLSPLLIDEGTFLLSDAGEALVNRTVIAGLEPINREKLVKGFDNKSASDGLEDKGLAELFGKLEDELSKLNAKITAVKEKRALLAMRRERYAAYRERVRYAPNPRDPETIVVLEMVQGLVADVCRSDENLDEFMDDFPEPAAGYVGYGNPEELSDEVEYCEMI